ncbi:helix-turn-helix domain-containing protein [Liquorilactobacillus uvarum]|uniref:HTH cro/C1-type domain-containing protein n=1 Tax=Liquorilactobacillus uvarum DSM 19971 TaxID=1423812 RepID=A0A0R1PZJ4_9LACO|nr:helix-turn-helix transcriptional regulator [Liquorilactobacillus uvarum]KRL37920.1 hypothetical protein FD20_GL002458 [Liquorilactobacillus uvarum DSM 19971]
MVNDNFSLNLKMIRKQRLLTQQSVAEKLHVSRKTISSLGKQVGIYQILKN